MDRRRNSRKGISMSPKLAQSLYLGGSIVTSVLGIALIWGGIDAGTAANLGQIVGGLVSLLGGTIPTTTAAVRVGKQSVPGGPLDPNAPPPSQAISAVEGIVAVGQQFQDLISGVSHGINQVQNMATGLAAVTGLNIPGLVAPGSPVEELLARVRNQDGATAASAVNAL